MYEEQTEEKRGSGLGKGGGKERRIERFISGDRRGRERKGKCAFSPPPPPGFCKSILPRKRWKEEEDQDGEIFVGSINHELFFLEKNVFWNFCYVGRESHDVVDHLEKRNSGWTIGTKQVSFSARSGIGIGYTQYENILLKNDPGITYRQ